MAAANNTLDVQLCTAAPPCDNNIDHTASISQKSPCSIVRQISTTRNAVASYRRRATRIPRSLSAYLPNACTNASSTNNRCVRPSPGTLRQFGAEISNVAYDTLDGLSSNSGNSCVISDELHKAPKIDAMIENFRLVSVIGRGRYGKVILTEYTPSSEYYALKVLEKIDQVKNDNWKFVMVEKRIFELVSKRKHPFLVNCLTYMQSREHLIFVMEYLPGGDLLHNLSTGRFTEDRCCFYAACVVLALEFLHSKNIMHRDLKLENLMIDRSGYVKLSDFDLCKERMAPNSCCYTFCGTPQFCSPEMVCGLGYTRATDWWSFGVVLYDMLVGQQPFGGKGDSAFECIVNQTIDIPLFLSIESHTILWNLLNRNADARLGSGLNGAQDVMQHRFFKHIDWEWEKLLRKELKPKFVPQIKNMEDVCNFDEEFTKEDLQLSSAKDKRVITDTDQALFKDFDFTSFVE